jgi:hypothetical protein
MGDTIKQWIDEDLVYHCQLSCVRLWEQDAAAALATGSLGLTVLSPLMTGISEPLVVQAVESILSKADPSQHGNLLSILATFADPVMGAEQLMQLVGKERIMESNIWNTLLAEVMEDKEAEIEQRFEQKLEEQRHALEEQKHALEEQRHAIEEQYKAQEEQYKAKEAELMARITRTEQDFHHALEEALMARFPQAPLALLREVRQVSQPSHINDLIVTLVTVQNVEEFEHRLHEILHIGKN